jgi:hypothetical protein
VRVASQDGCLLWEDGDAGINGDARKLLDVIDPAYYYAAGSLGELHQQCLVKGGRFLETLIPRRMKRQSWPFHGSGSLAILKIEIRQEMFRFATSFFHRGQVRSFEVSSDLTTAQTSLDVQDTSVFFAFPPLFSQLSPHLNFYEIHA